MWAELSEREGECWENFRSKMSEGAIEIISLEKSSIEKEYRKKIMF